MNDQLKPETNSMLCFSQPIAAVRWVHHSRLEANNYNPNKVAPPEMRLLELSILSDGWTQPVVTIHDRDRDVFVVVDGFHRYTVGKTSKKVQAMTNGMIPIVVIDKPLSDRMASTIRHNRARGRHGVMPMAKIVAQLTQDGWDDARIMRELGMDADEVLRLKQRTGLASLFAGQDFSRAWE